MTHSKYQLYKAEKIRRYGTRYRVIAVFSTYRNESGCWQYSDSFGPHKYIHSPEKSWVTANRIMHEGVMYRDVMRYW